MTDCEVERALGYTPCVCGKIDGTWHSQCYRDKTREQIAAGYWQAFAAARRHMKRQAVDATLAAVASLKTPNVRVKPAPTAWRAGQQAQNGPQAQRLMAGVPCCWGSA